MRLYLDQMFRIELAENLRSHGHEVIRASEIGHSRADDAEIIAYAIQENLILITLDEHFGNWSVLPLDRHPGVIRLKIHPPIVSVLSSRLIAFLKQYSPEQIKDHLIIIGPRAERWIKTSL
jgi:predicted nuclease of predicted toxin-antitoxin system